MTPNEIAAAIVLASSVVFAAGVATVAKKPESQSESIILPMPVLNAPLIDAPPPDTLLTNEQRLDKLENDATAVAIEHEQLADEVEKVTKEFKSEKRVK